MKIAICIVTYNRLESVKRLIQSIYDASYNQENVFDLIISIDYSGNDDIFNFCNNLKWKYGELILHRYTSNLGLKKHVLLCGDYVKNYDGIIMLEDDLVVSKEYTNYIEQVYPICKEISKVCGVSLYTYEKNEFSNFKVFVPKKNQNDIYLMKTPSSWGQFWTRNQWLNFKEWLEQNEKININEYDVPDAIKNWGEQSWKKLFSLYMSQNDLYFIFPYYAYSTNMSDVGIHNISSSNIMQCRLIDERVSLHLSTEFDAYITYDQYMESEYLKQLFEHTTIDLYGTKNKYDRYLISAENKNFKILNQWGLNLLPIELNIEKNIKGCNIFLYDTSKSCENKQKYEVDNFMFFYPYTKLFIIKYLKVVLRLILERIF